MEKKPIVAILAKFPLHVINPDFAGLGWHMATWLVAMHELLCSLEKYEIHWVTFRKGVKKRTVFQKGGQWFHVLPAYTLNYAQKTAFLHARWQMRRELKRIQPDLVHAWGTEDRYAACGADFRGKKILSMQGILSAYVERSPMDPFMCRQAAKEPQWLSRYSVITTESEWGVECVAKLAPQVPAVRWEYAAREAFFQAPRAVSETPTCLFGGSDSAVKDVDTLIKSFSSPELAHIRLLLAGVSPEKRPDLPANITALGGVPAERLMELLGQTWCLVMPSLADTSPNMVKEARVMGVPVITTTECGGKQYVEQGKSGFIFAPKDVEALKQHVLAVCADRETAMAMGEYGREDCRRALSRETMMAGLVAIYDQLLAE